MSFSWGDMADVVDLIMEEERAPLPPDIRGVYRDEDGQWFAENPVSLIRCGLVLTPQQMMALNATVGGEWDEELAAKAREYELLWRRKIADKLGLG